MNGLHIPRATYRLQFTPGFGFGDALRLLPYLQRLGISDIYASPVTRARAGSTHGYDVCDPKTVNPELGTVEEFELLLKEVSGRGMGWLQDIVPNHMAYSHENPYLVDVLEHGTKSRFADFFDITWDHQQESLRGRLLAPFLGKPYGQCIVDGELKVVFENGGLWAAYYDNRYPLSPESYWEVLGEGVDTLKDALGKDGDDYMSFLGALHTLNNLPGDKHTPERAAQCSMAKSVVRHIYERFPIVREYIENHLSRFAAGSPDGNARFDALMSKQNFRLAFWKVAAEELNYRRFFTVSDLIAVRVEYEHVFEETHSFILGLVEKGLINGLRIDHIDGLFDPAAYLRRLRSRAPNAYIVVEKILDRTESLPSDWPVQGTTGYDFLNHLGYVFCDRQSKKRFDTLYAKVVGERVNPEELQIDKRRLIIGKHMAGDIDNLARLVMRIAGVDLMGRDITLYGLRRALVEVLTHFPVYRTYITTKSFTDDDGRDIAAALRKSRETMAGLSVEFDFIERFLMMKDEVIHEAEFDEAWRSAVMRFQQFTGPLMAKGFEDTLFYVYNRHVALNEVGGWPDYFGISQKQFSEFIGKRIAAYPLSMNATATHDTKRGEDTRARLQILTEMPGEWGRRVGIWARLNRRNLTMSGNEHFPDRNDRYLFYQTLVGTFPADGSVSREYVSRIEEYMIKAVREAKVHTAWIKPDDEYEESLSSFVRHSLDEENNKEFIGDLRLFADHVSWFGMIDSLTQAFFKSVLPGIPDFYQGTELWDLTLVDPDNRRPVDFAKRGAFLNELTMPELRISDLLESPQDGRLKMFLIQRCLEARGKFRSLFENAGCSALRTGGVHRKRIMAFGRSSENAALVAVGPRLSTGLVKKGEYPLGEGVWKDTFLRLPKHLSGRPLLNVITGEGLEPTDTVLVGDVLRSFPVALLISSPE